jgi:protein-disulfide isomerase
MITSALVIAVCALVITIDWRAAPRRGVDRRIANGQSLAERGYVTGPTTANHTLVVFTDYSCSYCRYYARILDTLRLQYSEIRIIERHLPQSASAISWGAARIVECAGDQGRYAAMRELLLHSALDTADWGRLAAKATVPGTTLLKRCMNENTTTARIARDTAAAGLLQPTGTPTVVLDDLRFAAPPSLSVIMTKLAARN